MLEILLHSYSFMWIDLKVLQFTYWLVEWNEKEGKETAQQWEDDWDDDDVSDDFSLQLRRELESNNTEKK